METHAKVIGYSMKRQKMYCAYCSREREFPTDFPSSMYAICEDCYPIWVSNSESLWDKIVKWFKS